MSSPLTPPSGDTEENGKSGAVVKKLKVQAIKKDIKQVDNTSGLIILLPNN
jgi:large subunit ribosomal protein L22